MRRHLRLYRAFWRNCLRQAVEFRAHFWANLLTNVGWLFSLVLFMKLIYLNTRSVAGWSEGEMFLLVGTYSVMLGIADTLFYRNLSELPNQIRLGTLDFTLLRPVNSQFFLSLRCRAGCSGPARRRWGHARLWPPAPAARPSPFTWPLTFSCCSAASSCSTPSAS